MSPPPTKPGSEALRRLAEEGALRTARAGDVEAQLARLQEQIHVRVALGAHYGSRRRRILGTFCVLSGAVLAAVAHEKISPSFETPAVLVLIVTMLGFLVLQPVASAARLARERAWLEGLPFPLEGYFESLAATPEPSTRMRVELQFRGDPPPTNLLAALVRRADPAARVTETESAQIQIQGCPVSGETGTRVNGRFIYRNHRLVPYVHDIVDNALLPLHLEYPLARVVLRRTQQT